MLAEGQRFDGGQDLLRGPNCPAPWTDCKCQDSMSPKFRDYPPASPGGLIVIPVRPTFGWPRPDPRWAGAFSVRWARAGIIHQSERGFSTGPACHGAANHSEQRRALAMLADAGHRGYTDQFMMAHGFTFDLLASLIRAGLAKRSKSFPPWSPDLDPCHNHRT